MHLNAWFVQSGIGSPKKCRTVRNNPYTGPGTKKDIK